MLLLHLSPIVRLVVVVGFPVCSSLGSITTITTATTILVSFAHCSLWLMQHNACIGRAMTNDDNK
jgi:hypothetical protein